MSAAQENTVTDAQTEFEDWYVQNAFDYAANPIGSRDCGLMRKAWYAALAARQPGSQERGKWFEVRGLAAEVVKNLESFAASQHKAAWCGLLDDSLLFADQIQKQASTVCTTAPAQGMDLGRVREIRIPARNNLDPISVFVQDQAAGRGRIVVTCYGNAWQGFWNAMSDRTVMQFVAQCDPDYVAGSMLQGRQTRIAKHERDYATRIAAEVIAEFRTLIDGQRDGAPGVGNG